MYESIQLLSLYLLIRLPSTAGRCNLTMTWRQILRCQMDTLMAVPSAGSQRWVAKSAGSKLTGLGLLLVGTELDMLFAKFKARLIESDDHFFACWSKFFCQFEGLPVLSTQQLLWPSLSSSIYILHHFAPLQGTGFWRFVGFSTSNALHSTQFQVQVFVLHGK